MMALRFIKSTLLLGYSLGCALRFRLFQHTQIVAQRFVNVLENMVRSARSHNCLRVHAVSVAFDSNRGRAWFGHLSSFRTSPSHVPRTFEYL